MTGYIPETLRKARAEWVKGFPKDGEESKKTGATGHLGTLLGDLWPSPWIHHSRSSDGFVQSMTQIADFVVKNPESNKPVLERTLQDGVSFTEIGGSYLRARARKIESLYGANSEVTKRFSRSKANHMT